MGYLLVYITSVFWLATCSQKSEGIPRSASYSHQIGETNVRITIHDYFPVNDISFVLLHDNEQTATESAEAIVSKSGGRVVLIENNNKRNISFYLRGRWYSFDPNRMFTENGIRQSLQMNSRYNQEAAREISEFASFVLSHLGKPKLTVALHNNRNNTYSILRYASGSLKKEAEAVYRNPQMDPDDFVLTTSRNIYGHFRAAGINAVLQKSRPTDDGSLSVLSGKKGKDYINIESQHGHYEAQVKMIGLLYKMKF